MDDIIKKMIVIFQNKKFYLAGSAIILSGLFFIAGAFSVSAAECGKNQESFSFASFLNPVASLVEKVVKDFGYEVALASNPGDIFPGTCGSVTVGCSGATPTATISWTAAPSIFSRWITVFTTIQIDYYFDHYILTISPAISGSPFNTGTTNSFNISSGLTNNTTYSWSVEAYTTNGGSSMGYGYTNQPYGSFTTPNCAPASCTTPWGTTLASGSSVTAYSASSVPCGSTCASVSQTRTCTNGVLSGSYTNQSCSMIACPLPTITVTKAGTGSGTVISNPAGINCGVTCSASFYNPYNPWVILTASASTGSTFSGWSGCNSVSGNTCTVTMYVSKIVTATFTASSCSLPWGGTLTSGSSVTAYSASSVPCGSTCASQTRTCTNGALSGTYTNQSCSVAACPLTITKSGSGTVTSAPAGINCDPTCSASFNYGTSITLIATPAAGYLFSNWSGACSGTGTCTVTLDAAKSVTANFTAKTLLVSLSVSPSSGYRPLTVTLTATVTGTAVGTINYTFYCNRNDDGANITAGWDGKYDGQAATTKAHICTYSTLGTFSPKVIVERDGGVPNATDRKTVTVINRAPSANGLSVSQPNYCKSGPAATFSWTFSDPDPGDTQGAYQVQVATNPGFSGPGTVVDSGKVSSASNSYATGSGKLVYNTTYYWRVRVWDNYDLVSAWASGSNFTTPKHVYPTVNFKASPLSPSVNETVQFTDLTTGGATINGWTWNIQDATYQDGTNANSQNPKVKFTVTGTKTITLVAKDVDNYQCSNADTASSLQNLNIRLPLPGWKEVAP